MPGARSGATAPTNVMMARATPPWATTTEFRPTSRSQGRRDGSPFVPLSARHQRRLVGRDLGPGAALPAPEADLAEALVEAVARRVEPHGIAQEFHGVPGATERRRHEGQIVGVQAVASEQPAERPPRRRRLVAAAPIQRNVVLSLESALPVPIRLAMANEEERPPGIRRNRIGQRGLARARLPPWPRCRAPRGFSSRRYGTRRRHA